MGVGIADAVIKQGQVICKMGHQHLSDIDTDATDRRLGGGVFVGTHQSAYIG